MSRNNKNTVVPPTSPSGSSGYMEIGDYDYEYQYSVGPEGSNTNKTESHRHRVKVKRKHHVKVHRSHRTKNNEVTEAIPEEIPKEVSEEIPKDVSQEISKDVPEEISKDVPEEIPDEKETEDQLIEVDPTMDDTKTEKSHHSRRKKRVHKKSRHHKHTAASEETSEILNSDENNTLPRSEDKVTEIELPEDTNPDDEQNDLKKPSEITDDQQNEIEKPDEITETQQDLSKVETVAQQNGIIDTSETQQNGLKENIEDQQIDDDYELGEYESVIYDNKVKVRRRRRVGNEKHKKSRHHKTKETEEQSTDQANETTESKTTSHRKHAKNSKSTTQKDKVYDSKSTTQKDKVYDSKSTAQKDKVYDSKSTDQKDKVYDAKAKMESKPKTNVASAGGWEAEMKDYGAQKDLDEIEAIYGKDALYGKSTVYGQEPMSGRQQKSETKKSLNLKSLFGRKSKNDNTMELSSTYVSSKAVYNTQRRAEPQMMMGKSNLNIASKFKSVFSLASGKSGRRGMQPAKSVIYVSENQAAPVPSQYEGNYASHYGKYSSGANNVAPLFYVQNEKFNAPHKSVIIDGKIDEDAKLLELETKYKAFFTEALRYRPDNLAHNITCVLEDIVIFYQTRRRLNLLKEELNNINLMKVDYNRCLISTHRVNRDYNADKRFIPYDANRVLINNPNCLINKSDYICASYVRDPILEGTFIITQTPMKSTIESFWVMIYEQQCHQIFCLDSQSFGQTSATVYWPDEGKMFQYMFFSVRLEFINRQRNFIERIVVLKPYDPSMPPVIVNHFTATVDYERTSIYEGFNHLLFLANSKYLYSNAHPITIHYNGGFGLPAVFAAAVMVQYQIRAARLFSPLITAHIIRYQLMNCFKEELHYRMLYELIADFVSAATSLERHKFILAGL